MQKRKSVEPGARPPGSEAARVADDSPPLVWPLPTPPEPHAWQLDAQRWWVARGRRGIIEAVTGTGKTLVGIAAIADALRRRERVLVLVPTIVLQQQWAERVSGLLPHANVCLLGGNSRHDLRSAHDVVIAVVNSAVTRVDALADGYGLLVADECHRYGAPTHRQALLPCASARLGLTATLERGDDAVDTVLRPYFGNASYVYGFDRAESDRVLASFVVADVGVRLSPDERAAFEAADDACRRARGSLIRQYDYPADDFGDFMARAVEASKRFSYFGEAKLAKTYIRNFHERSRVLAESPARMATLAALAPAIEGSGRALVFTETVDAADRALAQLRCLGIRAGAYHTGNDADARASTLERFGAGSLHCLVAVKALDEGVDVPDADLAIVMAASKSKRQMIQRLGRVVRKKTGDRYARLAILFAEDTHEDPARGAHEAFREVIDEAADEIVRFGPDETAEALRFLERFAGPSPAATAAGTQEVVARGAARQGATEPGPPQAAAQDASSPPASADRAVRGDRASRRSVDSEARQAGTLERLVAAIRRLLSGDEGNVERQAEPPPPVPDGLRVDFDATRDALRVGRKEFDLGRDLAVHQSGQKVDYEFRGGRVASLLSDGSVQRLSVVVGGRATPVLEIVNPTLEVKQAALALAIAVADAGEARRLDRLGDDHD